MHAAGLPVGARLLVVDATPLLVCKGYCMQSQIKNDLVVAGAYGPCDFDQLALCV